MGRLDIIYKRVDELIPYVNNPRHNDQAVDAVASSIKNFGFKVPIIVDAGNEIVAGHTRLKAAKKLGMKEVPVIVASDLDDDQIRAFRVADNKVTELADWDFDLLKIELTGLDDLFTGFEIGELATLLDDPSEVVDDDYEVVVPETPKSKYGEIYQLGRHRLMCGDSTDVNCVTTLLGEARVDLFLTDPPYNVDYVGKTQEALTIENDAMDGQDYRAFLTQAFAAADEQMKPGAVFYIWHADTEGYNVRGACHDIGWPVRQCLIWNKHSMVMGRQDYHWKHEPCLYGWKPGGPHLWASDRRQTTILEFDRPMRSLQHPTMKPVPLFDYLIQNNTKKEDLVLDLFGGAGTTIIACEQNGRNACMMELDPKYVDVIIDRWETFTGQAAELIKRKGDNA